MDSVLLSLSDLRSTFEFFHVLVPLYVPLVFLVSLAASFLLTPLARRAGVRLGFIDYPRAGELQKVPLARTGGYAIFAAFIIAIGLSFPLVPRFPDEYPRLLGLLLGAVIIMPVAFVDDLKRLGPMPQLAAQVLVALVAISLGVVIDNVANPFGGIIPLPLWITVPFTLLWFVGMINTLNFIDTMDGLAGGITAIAALVLFARALHLGQYSIAVLSLALAGACLGFLPYNLHPARVFMGTSGSMFLGYALAVLAVIGGAKIATTLTVLSIPILDTALVIARRSLAGRSPFKGGDSAHLPHRMLAVGLPQPLIVFLLYALSIVLGYLALALSATQKMVALGIMALVLGGAIAFVAYRNR